MKFAKRALALFLAALMCAGLLSAAADDVFSDRYNVVAIGNGSTAGFGLDDYGEATTLGKWNDRYSKNGYSFGVLDNMSKEAYAYTLSEYMNTLSLGGEVELTNLAMDGMRSDELRAILQPDFRKLADNKGIRGDTYLAKHLDAYKAWFSDPLNSLKLGGADIYSYFRKAIMQADVITLDLSMANVENYLIERLQSIFGVNGYDPKDYSETVQDLQNELDFNVTASELAVKAAISGFLPSDSTLPADEIAAAFTYCYCDFVVNFTKSIEFILGINPNVKILVVSAVNMFTGLKLDLGKKTLDLGALCSAYVSLVNNFLTNSCRYNKDYYYADMSLGLKTFTQNLALAVLDGGVDYDFALPLIADAFDMEYGEALGIGDLFLAKKLRYDYLTAREKELIRNNDLGSEYDAVVAELKQIDDAGFRNLLSEAEEILGIYQRASRMTTLDLYGVVGIMQGGTANIKNNVLYALKNWDAATSAQKSMTYVYLRFIALDGAGNLPDAYGHSQKFEAVKAAYTTVLPASTSGDDSVLGSISGAFGSFLGIFRSPVLEKISGMFSHLNFSSFGDFFRALGNGFVNLFTRIFPT